MAVRIVIIQGHPDPGGGHFGNALADAYARGAEAGGHQVRRIEVAGLDFPLLRNKQDWEDGSPAVAICQAQSAVDWANHLVIVYPLWLGSMPALLKGFLEQVFRPGFAISKPHGGKAWKKSLGGKSARVVVTMGMPAFIYRWYFLAHSLKSLERNILHFCGIGPVRESLVGLVEAADGTRRGKWLDRMQALGRNAK
ncbi:MAG TPA: NAD(P)H-dependent oxidoreductase [Burkholderiales bacterium]|nr:NAD(P)H-dependent oxidoreductase [Burkholderiales bacterium]